MNLLDVADLSWSPDGQYLASCGFDSKVCVWDATTFGNHYLTSDRVTTIEQHSGFVKGITWDPAGKYLATQSDDSSVKIFRVSDWRVEKDIIAPFDGVTTTTFFRRLSWSPDGAAVATVNGESGGCSVAPILYREDWQSAVCLVGHEAPVEVASFNPHLFKFNDPDSGTRIDTTVCALGSQDCGISVWWTGTPRAIACAQQVFTNSVLDICWTSDGLGMFACSYDGTVVYMEFNESDFGSRVGQADIDKSLSKYGSKKTKNLIPESVDIVLIEKQLASQSDKLSSRFNDTIQSSQTGFGNTVSTAPLQSNVQNIMATEVKRQVQPTTPSKNIFTISPVTPGEKQQESITKDGKRRIKPVLIESNRNAPVEQLSQNSVQQPLVANTVSVKKMIVNNQFSTETAGVQYQLPVVIVKESHSNLQIPQYRSNFALNSRCKISNRQDTIEFKNTLHACSIIATQGNEIVWTMEYKSPCLLASKGSNFIALAFADCTLHLVSCFGGQRFTVAN